MSKKKSEKIEDNAETFRKLRPEELRWVCPTDIFRFETTAEVEGLEEIVGQPRAIEAIKLGARLSAKGYNIFVSGLPGTGRFSTVKKVLESEVGFANKFYDYCYVNNFQEPEKPQIIKLKAGEGKKFSKAMDSTISYLKRRIPKLFEEDDYQNVRRKLVEQYQENEGKILKDFDEKIKPFNFVRGQYENQQGMMIPDVFPIIEGKPLHIDVLNQLVTEGKLTAGQAEEIRKNYLTFHNEIISLSQTGMKLLQEFTKNLSELDKSVSEMVINAVFNEIEVDFGSRKVKKYISSVKEDIIENLNIFLKPPDTASLNNESDEKTNPDDLFNVYKVNVILDNSQTEKQPIIVETSPTYSNLFGSIEKVYDKTQGIWKTDFTKIKAGSLLRADRGYLIINAEDLFAEEGVWNLLKRHLLYEKYELSSSEMVYQITQTGIKPEPFEIKAKVVLIGTYQIYYLLNAKEPAFRKIFKINAPFDYVSANNQSLIENFSKFISKVCKEDGIPHLTKDGMAALMEEAAESAGSQDKLTLQFSHLSNLVVEASAFVNGKKKVIDRAIIEKTLEMRRFRNSLFEEKSNEGIINNRTIIKTQGKSIGEINGLVIYTLGDFEYGEPSRITASVSVGHSGIINIDREASMSGKLHNKAVLIISGFLRERFAQKFPLSVSASIAFEQAYEGIDGDSASLAEIYVLLSAISREPINQSFAITGSMSQKGDVQPIGGVNEKLRGFWGICSKRGLDGTHAAIIPEQNVSDLMLGKEMINDVKSGKFSIYSIKNVEDGIPLLFGLEAGTPDDKGNYPPETLFGKVQSRLAELYKFSRPRREDAPKTK